MLCEIRCATRLVSRRPGEYVESHLGVYYVGVIRIRVISNTLLLFCLTGAIFLSFQDQPVERNLSQASKFLEYTSIINKKRTCAARKCQDKMTAPRGYIDKRVNL